jgi:prepilin-type processing-associated H-X9-DG protein
MILPLVERSDIYNSWQTAVGGFTSLVGTSTTTVANTLPTDATATAMAFLQCPSDPPDNPNGALAYVVNRGRNGVDNNPAVGVCFNLYENGTTTANSKVNLDYIGAHDGSSNTLLLSETLMTATGRIGRTNSATTPSIRPYLYIDQTVSSSLSVANTTTTPTTFYSRPFPKWYSPYKYESDTSTYTLQQAASLTEIDLGFEWSSLGFGVYSGTTSAAGGFNARSGATIADQIGSRHGGLTIVAFCDGHVSRLNDSLSVDVFRQIMTPYGEGYTTRDSGDKTKVTNDGPNAILNDNSL